MRERASLFEFKLMRRFENFLMIDLILSLEVFAAVVAIVVAVVVAIVVAASAAVSSAAVSESFVASALLFSDMKDIQS